MNPGKDDLERLNKELQTLIQRHNVITQDIKKLRDELREAKTEDILPNESQVTQPRRSAVPEKEALPGSVPNRKSAWAKVNIERFIGENLINKIGILVTIIGVIIGAKYTIEHNLISPAVRIILGYLLAIGLLFIGFRLKEKYRNYSAVLVSGALAIMYFLTFAAFSFYALIPLYLAYSLMVLWTAFGVYVAIYFSQQVIAIIGLVGAYAIPFLLSPEEGNPVVLLSYVSLINVGIVAIAYWKEWRLLNYFAFAFTWLIFLAWFTEANSTPGVGGTALLFAIIFFLIFYMMFLSYKLIKREAFKTIDIILVLLNSFIFYGFGYAAIGYFAIGNDYLGLFTILNAVVHLGVALVVNKIELADKRLFYFTLILVLTFITIAIPVQLGGVWTPILWSVGAAMLFWVGRKQQMAFYEKIAYPMILLAFFALMSSWGDYNYLIHDEGGAMPILNRYFLTSFIFLLSMVLVNYLSINEKPIEKPLPNEILDISRYALPVILLFTTYVTFLKEIELYWENVGRELTNQTKSDTYLSKAIIYNLKTVWNVAYTLGFTGILALLNLSRIKTSAFTMAVQILAMVAVFYFLTGGLYSLSELREGYLREEITAYLQNNSFNIWLRYLVSLLFIVILYLLHKYSKLDNTGSSMARLLVIYMHAAIIWFASSELIHWLDMAGYPNAYKIWLSILWGTYSVYLIAWGIYLKQQQLRIMAISILGITLIKLAAYDISSLNTLRKTIVFVALGLLLLIASFLYNKYKALIFDADEEGAKP